MKGDEPENASFLVVPFGHQPTNSLKYAAIAVACHTDALLCNLRMIRLADQYQVGA
jgi:hypothetical protein